MVVSKWKHDIIIQKPFDLNNHRQKLDCLLCNRARTGGHSGACLFSRKNFQRKHNAKDQTMVEVSIRILTNNKLSRRKERFYRMSSPAVSSSVVFSTAVFIRFRWNAPKRAETSKLQCIFNKKSNCQITVRSSSGTMFNNAAIITWEFPLSRLNATLAMPLAESMRKFLSTISLRNSSGHCSALPFRKK